MHKTIKNVGLTVAGLAALGLGASALAGAASGTSSTSTTQSPPPMSYDPAAQGGSSRQAPPWAAYGPPGSARHEGAEKAATGEAAEKASKAALASTGPGKVTAVTTDITGHGYEVEVTKTDGTKTVVHLDSSFKVMAGPQGMHPDGPPPAGSSGQYGPPSGAPSGPPQGYGTYQGGEAPQAQTY